MRQIRIFDLHFDEEFRHSYHEGCERIFDEGHLTDHTFCRQFERDFASYCGTTYSLAVSNGTAALELALRSLDLKGKKVLLPTNTFIASAVAILNAGAIPVPLDSEKEYYSLSFEELEKSFSHDVGAVMVVHIGGHLAPSLRKIKEFCLQNKIPLIEDAAHAHGASLDGIKAGAWGDFGAFSHFTTKLMTTGEGGSLVCSNEGLYQRAYSIRRFGMDPKHSISHIQEGTNFKMSEFQALMGTLELKRLESRREKRRLLAKRYQENLRGSSWRTLQDTETSLGSYYKQVVLSPLPRVEVERELKAKGVALTGGVFFIPLHRQPVYQERFRKSQFPVADYFADNHLCPPCYPELSLDDIDLVCEFLLKLKK